MSADLYIVFRLKYLLLKAENGEVGREELLVNLGYVVNVLDSAFYDESRSASMFACYAVVIRVK